MNNLPRTALLIACGLVLVSMGIGLLVLSPGRADVGVRPVLPGGSSLKPEEETPIQMAAEKVVMDVRPASEADNALVKLNPEAYGWQFQPIWFPAVAEVEADFTMKNPTSEALTMTVWFPLASALENVAWDELNSEEIVPRIAGFQVAVDGEPVDYTVSELPNPQGADKPPLPWASFPVAFQAGKETNIHVSYLLPLQPALRGSGLALYYIFQTGAGWAGPIGQAELILNLPYPASAETLVGMPPGGLNLPYFISDAQAGTPAGAVLQGDQARWAWQNFEPGAGDDFAIWLMDLDVWEALETARAAVQANPGDGQAWLDLASIYRSLATVNYNLVSVFSASYLPTGIEAYQRAADLLPEHPAPHAGLALLTLAPYMTAKNASPEVIQAVQDELATARELEARNPSLAEKAGISGVMVEDVLFNIYFYNEATATAQWAAWSTDWAKETVDTAAMQTPSVTPTQELIPTSTPIPSATPQPAPPTPLQAAETGSGLGLSLILAATGVLLIVVIYIIVKRRR